MYLLIPFSRINGKKNKVVESYGFYVDSNIFLVSFVERKISPEEQDRFYG